jgi:predicted NAD/FAD-binding protein
MPRDSSEPVGQLNIGVIGTGIAGMSAAWLLSQAHRVTVYERHGRLGGHSNTVDVPGPSGAIPVDTGFIVYNDLTYPNLVALFQHLGVETQASSMSFAASIGDGALEYSGSDLGGLFAQRSNVIRPRFWRMLRDIVRFYRQAPAVLDDPSAVDWTLGDYLRRGGYSASFVEDHILPVAAAIWSTPAAEISDCPLVPFVRFCVNHGLLRITGRPLWSTVSGGSRKYVQRLTASYADRIRLNSPVASIRRTAYCVEVTMTDGNHASYDGVVIATHADEALGMLVDPSQQERALLGAFPYTENIAILHGDASLMPRRRPVWSSWNYLSGGAGSSRPELCVTYWMNSLQGIDPRVPLFVTLNPFRQPAETATFGRFRYHHPSYDRGALRAQARLAEIQGLNRTWYCGSYFGAGFHEDALASGLAAAEGIGGVRRPWGPPAAAGRDPHWCGKLPSAAE